MSPPERPPGHRARVVSWALYDWANSAFATTVMAGFFPIFFKDYWNPGGVAATTSTFRLGLANSLGSVAIVLLAPVLGAIGDAARARKRFLLAFATLGIVTTGALFLVARGNWSAAMLLYVLASIGFMGGNVFYDSLLVGLVPRGGEDRASALGYALGYLGGGLLFAFDVALVLAHDRFGISDRETAVRISFLSVALWWGLFSIPLIARVPEPTDRAFLDERHRPAGRPGAWVAVRSGIAQIRDTFRHLRRLRPAFLFLIAYWLYIDGVDTIIRMAVDDGRSIGLESGDLIQALLIVQFVGFPAAVAFGLLGERIGPKRAILAGLVVYAGVTVFAAQMDTAGEFFVLSVVVGLVQGGVQALSRSLFARMVPADRASQFFGFYNMLGKFAAIIGPLIVGAVGVITGSPRQAILAVLVLFVAGGIVLLRVDVDEGARVAREAEQG